MDTLILLCVIFFLLLLISVYLVWNTLRKNRILETYLEDRENSIAELTNRIFFIKNELEIIDKKGHFQSDDEVGFFFKEINKMNDMLLEIVEIEEKITE